jgi:two-component system, OmpR family, KDP operon response regulator KdpE
MASVVVIDDEVDVRDALAVALGLAGHSVRLAANGPEGIAACRLELPELVITDLVMPQAHGFDVISALRALSPLVKIIAISGGGGYWQESYQPRAVTTTAYLAAALEMGANAILTKPFSSEELIDAVRRVLPAPAADGA